MRGLSPLQQQAAGASACSTVRPTPQSRPVRLRAAGEGSESAEARQCVLRGHLGPLLPNRPRRYLRQRAREVAGALPRDEGDSVEEARRRSFEAPDAIDVKAQASQPPPEPESAAPSWELWNKALANAATPGAADEASLAAQMDAAADAIAEEELRRTRRAAEQAVESVLLAVVGDGGREGSQLVPPSLSGAGPGGGRALLLWAWARKRGRFFREAAAAARWLAAVVLLATAAAQAWGRPALNDRLLPAAAAAVSSASGRPLRIGRIRWLLPTGLTGLTPVATLGPTSIGACRPGEGVEGSSAEVKTLQLWIDPLATIFSRRPVIRAHCAQPTLHAVQARNFSWLGYPDDTHPVSSRPVPSTGGGPMPETPENTAAAAKLPPVLLSSVSFSDGTALLQVHSDGPGAAPRRVSGLNGTLNLSSDMRSLDLDLSGKASQHCPPPPGSPRRISMPTSEKRHLRSHPTAAEKAAEAAEAARAGVGGGLRIRVVCSHLATPGRWSNLEVRVGGFNLHAPIIGGLLSIPMDVLSGRLDGEVVVRCFDADSWDFPLLGGKVRGSGLGFHFADAPDDFAGVAAEFQLDGRRLYLHGASGFYGAIPLSATGDIDIRPLVGEYHLSASVPGVEANDLRETLGGRPTPKPVAGSLQGNLHVTGPLEKPVFMGTIAAKADRGVGLARSLARANPGSGPSAWAAEALRDSPSAVAAFDRVAFESVKAVWTLDTASGVFVLHEARATPLGGGAVRGTGYMRVAPGCEMQPDAMRFAISGEEVDGARLIKSYETALAAQAAAKAAAAAPAGAEVPPLPELPPQLLAGLRGASFEAVLAGSLMTPGCEVKWSAPQAAAQGTVSLSRPAIEAQLRTPSLEGSCRLETTYPPLSQAMCAVTQEEAAAAAEFTVSGAEGEVTASGLDVLSLLQTDTSQANKPERLRLRLSGKARFTGRLQDEAAAPAAASGPSYKGEVQLSSLRLNQLLFAPSFGGTFSAGPGGLSCDARGRPDESLRLDFSPAVDVSLSDAHPEQAPGGVSLQLRRGPLRVDASLAGGRARASVAGVRLDDLELGSLRGRLESAAAECDWGQRVGTARLRLVAPRFSGLQGESLECEGSWVGESLRLERGELRQQRSLYRLQGECALPSPQRGASWSADLEVPYAEAEEALPSVRLLRALRRGGGMRADYARARAAFLERLRESGVSGDTLSAQLSAAVRAAKLGAAAAQQQSGSAAKAAAQQAAAAALAVVEAAAGLESPSRAAATQTAASPAERLAAAVASASTASQAAAAGAEGVGGGPKAASAALSGFSDDLPGLQDVRGSWSGTVSARGSFEPPGAITSDSNGGTAAAPTAATKPSVDVAFDLRGSSWAWGPAYAVESLIAKGAFSSVDGLQLDALQARSGQTELKASGSLLGPKQNCTVRLDDFPAPLLQHLARTFSGARQHSSAGNPAAGRTPPRVASRDALASAAARAQRGRAGSRAGPVPPARFTSSAEARAAAAASLRAAAESDAASVAAGQAETEASESGDGFLSGALYASAEIGGSASAPEAKLSMRLVDGALRTTRLAVAEAGASLTAQQRCSFELSLAPAAGEGHLKLSGSAPLRAYMPGGAGLPGGAATAGSDAASSPPPTDGSDALVADGSVKDSGMLLLAALAPRGALEWRSGAADVSFALRGTPSKPSLDGLATLGKASVALPELLARPLTGLSGCVRVSGDTLSVEGLEARLGRRGHLKVRGALPLRPPAAQQGAAGGLLAAKSWAASLVGGSGSGSSSEGGVGVLRVDVGAAELRAERRFSGQLDATLAVRGALLAPEVSGEMQFSRGIAYLSSDLGAPEGGGPGASPSAAPASATGAEKSDASPAAEKTSGTDGVGAGGAEGAAAASGERSVGPMAVQRAKGGAEGADAVAAATAADESGDASRAPGAPVSSGGGIGGFFRNAAARAEQARRAADKAATAASATPASRPSLSPSASAQSSSVLSPGVGLSFRALRVRLGPELRVVYPLLLNFGLSGEVELSGRASAEPGALRPAGVVSLTNGEVNLLATQARLNREHANRVVFDPDHALDPLLDVCLNSADLRVRVAGRASAWQRGLTITRPGAPGGEAAALTPSEAARVFEGQLAGSLLQEDGQLAFSNLAASTIATLLPKIETQGQLGSARWRLVSAPSIPGLLSLDPSTEPFKGLASLTLGTEVEVQFGPSFSASVTRKLNDSDMETQFSAIYQLSKQLRVQLNAVSSAVTRLLFQFNT